LLRREESVSVLGFRLQETKIAISGQIGIIPLSFFGTVVIFVRLKVRS